MRVLFVKSKLTFSLCCNAMSVSRHVSVVRIIVHILCAFSFFNVTNVVKVYSYNV